MKKLVSSSQKIIQPLLDGAEFNVSKIHVSLASHLICNIWSGPPSRSLLCLRDMEVLKEQILEMWNAWKVA